MEFPQYLRTCPRLGHHKPFGDDVSLTEVVQDFLCDRSIAPIDTLVPVQDYLRFTYFFFEQRARNPCLSLHASHTPDYVSPISVGRPGHIIIHVQLKSNLQLFSSDDSSCKNQHATQGAGLQLILETNLDVLNISGNITQNNF
jgi:hypothetical protein